MYVLLSLFTALDVDECAIVSHNCSLNGQCSNTEDLLIARVTLVSMEMDTTVLVSNAKFLNRSV